MTAALRNEVSDIDDLTDVERVAECRARAKIYRLLAGVFLEEPGADYLNALRSPEVMDMLTAMGARFDEDFTAAALPELMESLACEYAVLFLVAGGCPAVESVRLTGRYQQQPYFETRDFYRQSGFQLKQGKHAVFEDQLGVQLSFIAELLDRSATMLEAGNEAEHVRLTKEIKRFWVQHPGKWVRGYATLLQRAAAHSFYREMGKLLGAFAAWEIDLLALKVEDLDGGKLKVPKAEIEYEFDPDEPVCNACEKGQSADNDEDLYKIDISLIEARLQGAK